MKRNIKSSKKSTIRFKTLYLLTLAGFFHSTFIYPFQSYLELREYADYKRAQSEVYYYGNLYEYSSSEDAIALNKYEKKIRKTTIIMMRVILDFTENMFIIRRICK
jgi:hypothetical protein